MKHYWSWYCAHDMCDRCTNFRTCRHSCHDDDGGSHDRALLPDTPPRDADRLVLTAPHEDYR